MSQEKIIDNLIACSVVMAIKCVLLEQFLRNLSERENITINGQSFDEWFEPALEKELEIRLLEFEEENPASAAYMQQVLDAMKAKVKKREIERGIAES